MPAGETVGEELARVALGESEEAWILLNDTVTGAEEETSDLIGVDIRELDEEGVTAKVVVKEIPAANEVDDVTAVEAYDGISKEAEKKT